MHPTLSKILSYFLTTLIGGLPLWLFGLFCYKQLKGAKRELDNYKELLDEDQRNIEQSLKNFDDFEKIIKHQEASLKRYVSMNNDYYVMLKEYRKIFEMLQERYEIEILNNHNERKQKFFC